MKVYNSNDHSTLRPELQDFLKSYRHQRQFIASSYADQKAEALNIYMKNTGLKACVVAVSGGVDSAVILALVHHAAQQANSSVKKIVPLLLPIYYATATTNQREAVHRGQELCKCMKLKPTIVDLTTSFKTLKGVVDHGHDVVGEGWASGQLVSYIRTPAIYYTTSLLSQQGKPAIVCGTTNLDEGGYLGFFGKASDGMVDIQLISDLHKSEVYSLARYLQVPHSIITAAPTGDMYDGRIDEEVFGTSYDFVELYLKYLTLSKEEKQHLQGGWSVEARKQFTELAGRLENLHKYNAHKYLAKSPAIHLDILPARVPGGWNND